MEDMHHRSATATCVPYQAHLRSARKRATSAGNALSRFRGGGEWSVEPVLDGREFRCETAGDPTSERLWEATAELAVVSPEARGAATGGALLSAASARRRAKHVGISPLVWHALTKAKSALAAAFRFRRGPASGLRFSLFAFMYDQKHGVR